MTEESSREKIVCLEGKIYRTSYYELIDPHVAEVCSVFDSNNETKKRNKSKAENVNIESIITLIN